MEDLLKKLNVLVKATLNDALTGDSRRNKLVSPSGDKGDKPSAVQEGNQQIGQLRQRINETLVFEDELQKQIQSLQSEVANWDEQADSAVKDSDDAKAHYAVEQMQRAQERLNMVQSDLAAHEKVTQELIYHVNTLEAAIDVATQKQAESPTETVAEEKVSSVLRDMGNKILELRDQIAARNEVAPEPESSETRPEPVEDDLAKRRQRLAKPE
jgi:phage shock protein A